MVHRDCPSTRSYALRSRPSQPCPPERGRGGISASSRIAAGTSKVSHCPRAPPPTAFAAADSPTARTDAWWASLASRWATRPRISRWPHSGGPSADPSVDRRGGDLDEDACLDQRHEPLGPGLHLDVPLGVGEHRREALVAQREQHVGKLEGPAVVRRLDEQVPTAAEPEPPQLLRRQLHRPVERDLAAGPHLQRDPGRLELGPELRDPQFHRLGARGPVVAHVWRAGDHGDPVLQGSPRDVDAVGEGARAVVDPGQDVRVQVDHRSTI